MVLNLTGFDLSFTVIDDWLQEIARKASLITSSAGRTFALPERISARRRRTTTRKSFSALLWASSSRLVRLLSAISARDLRGRLSASIQIFCAVVLMLFNFVSVL